MFTQVIFGGGFLGVLIWLLLFATSTAAVAISIKLFISIRKGNFISEELANDINTLCRQKELNEAYGLCHERSDAFSRVMDEVFKHYNNDQKTHEESATAVVDKSARHLLRQINTLQMCGNIAPMLGLLGTVTGMVSAFMGLGTAMGPEKASVLAVSISQALYTTAAGLLIAVPCLAFVNYFRNTLEKRIQDLNEAVSDIILELER
tara:strand:+ start:72 stop:689 length:618 start_codon:yes stop_codon:yes gene_type:complete